MNLNLQARFPVSKGTLLFATAPICFSTTEWRCVVRTDDRSGCVVEYEFRPEGTGDESWVHQNGWLPGALPEYLLTPNRAAIDDALAGRLPPKVKAGACEKMPAQFVGPARGMVGFYRPDVGTGLSPNLVLKVDAKRMTVFASDLVLVMDVADWMSLEEMRVQARGLATSDRYGPGGEMHEMLPRMLSDRFDALVLAVQLQERAGSLLVEHGPQPLAKGGEDYVCAEAAAAGVRM